MAQTSEDFFFFFNIDQLLLKMNAQKLSLFTATLLIDSEQIKNKGRKVLK